MPHPLFPNDEFPAEVLPFCPESFYEGDGYDWIRQLPTGWKPVALWGSEGWDLGAWPYIVVAHYDCPLDLTYGVATYTEGDVTVSAWGSREARDAETDEIALGVWHDRESAPADLPARFRGPYVAA